MNDELQILRKCDDSKSPTGWEVMFFCPGCGCGHRLWVNRVEHQRWEWNGSFTSPTFSPSILVTMSWTDYQNVQEEDWGPWVPDPKVPGAKGRDLKPEAKHKAIERKDICHSYVRDGKIQFLPDSTHALAGQTVPLPGF